LIIFFVFLFIPKDKYSTEMREEFSKANLNVRKVPEKLVAPVTSGQVAPAASEVKANEEPQ
jgi:hypothetical protein